MARAFVRAVAAYFSDVLLWISIASAFEVFLVVGMGLLCILSAGYFFEGMKKNPFVLVFGGIVALAGTFLMFREVRGMIFPPPPAVIAAPAQEQPAAKPQSDAIMPPSAPAADAFKPFTLACAGLSQPMCSINPKCTWSMSINACLTSTPAAPAPGWNFPSSSYELTTCVLLPEAACKETRACYWSPLFKRCEKLIFGTGLGGAKPSEPSCNSLSEPVCKVRSGCVWILNGCMTDLLKKPLGQ